MTSLNSPTNNTRNYLALDEYIISKDLHLSLNSGTLYSNVVPEKSNTNKFYVIMIRVLNRDSRSLVYNYISYPHVFYYTFVYFLYSRSKLMGSPYKEPGNFLSAIDKYLHSEPVEDKLMFSKTLVNLEKLIDNITNSYYLITNKEILGLITRLVIHTDTHLMSQLVDLALKKDHESFVQEILGSVDNYHKIGRVLSLNKNIESISIINGCAFIVKDLEKFILNVRDNNYNLNAGPQAQRGQVNSINNSLSILDMEYRKSLYNHNYYRFSSSSNYAALRLDRDKFSFNNIHMNLGGVRWYSTKVRSRISLKSTKSLLSQKSVNDESYIFNQLGEYLNNLPVNEDTQLKIENFLSQYSSILYEKKEQRKNKNSLINYDLISNNFTKLLKDKDIILNDFINNTRKRVYVKKPNRKNELILYYFNNLLKVVDNSHIISTINGRLLRVININNKLSNTESSICLDLGRELVKNYHYCLYKNYKSSIKKDNVDYTMSDWKKENIDIINIYNDKNDNFTGSLGGMLEKWMLDLNLVEQDWLKIGRTESHNILLPSEEVSSTLKDNNNMVHLPHKMPMIVKPKLYYRKFINGYVKERLGGYLLNDVKFTDELIKSKWNLKEPSKIRDENVIYDLVNNINSVGFKINKDVLNFIDNYGREYNLISIDDYQYLLSKSKLNKSEYIELESFLSKKGLQENILGLARAYSNIHEFYLPVRLDFRGRVNCISEYLNYQSNELAKSLLLFSKPEKIGKVDNRAIGYLKAYGANCYGNKLDKKSWNERIDWIDNNLDDIINFRNGELILQSDNKLLFIAFCFEYNRLLQSFDNNDSSYFETYLPIRLDATCNGYQHLALLSLDHNLAKQLNLTKSTWNDPPKDFYSFMGTNLVNIYRNKLASNISVNDRESHTRLAKLEILRAMLKKAVMTKPYNTTPLAMISKIQENFELCDNINEIPFLDRWYRLKNDHEVKLKEKDFRRKLSNSNPVKVYINCHVMHVIYLILLYAMFSIYHFTSIYNYRLTLIVIILY